MQLDVASSRAVAKRFGISSTPAVLLFRDRGMYSVSLAGVTSPDADKLAAAVTAFVEGGYEQQVRDEQQQRQRQPQTCRNTWNWNVFTGTCMHPTANSAN